MNNKIRKRRSYKIFLDPSYSKEKVSVVTNYRWRKLLINNGALTAKEKIPIRRNNPVPNNNHQTYLSSDSHTVCSVTSSSNEETINKDGLMDVGESCYNGKDNNSENTCDIELGSDDDFNNTVSDTEADEKNNDNVFLKTIMFQESQLTVKDVIVMIQAFTLKFNITQKGRLELLNLIKKLSGNKFESFNFSNYRFAKMFDPPNHLITNHYYCEECGKFILKSTTEDQFKPQAIHCEFCQKNIQVNSSSCSFTTINIQHQLKLLFSDKNVCRDLSERIFNKNENNTNNEYSSVSDVQDGILYKQIYNDHNKNYITLNMNTDGAPIFNNSKRSMWPIQAIINELSPTYRFRNIILCGFWITKSEPKANTLNLFLSSFLQEIEKINTFQFITIDNEKIMLKAVPLCFCVDTVARPILQNRVQFNGYKGCSWCLHNGVHVNGTVRYPLEETDSEKRTHANHVKDIKTALLLNRFINGIKGNTVLANAHPFFDIVWGFPVDYMHGVLLGVTKYMWVLWSCTPKQTFSLTLRSKREIDERIIRIKPPNEIHRLTRKMSDFKNFKASEWKSFLLFYAIPVLNGILDKKFVQHFTLLVSSIHSLLKVHITEEDLKTAEYDLLRFVGEFEILYGRDYSTFNLHSLLHLVDSVKYSGPLWATSTFPFESEIYIFKQQINGPKGVETQVVKKFLQIQKFKQCIKFETGGDICRDYCNSLFYGHNSPIKVETSNDSGNIIKFLGRANHKGHFKKCIINKSEYCSTLYSKNDGKRNNTAVQLITGEFALIEYFFQEEHVFLMNVKILTLCENFQDEFNNLVHIHKIDKTVYGGCKIYPVSHIKNKCIYIDFDNSTTYVCTFPNFIEIQ